MSIAGDNNNRLDPVVSVITPFWNAERFLDEAIRSVLEQTYGGWELILVDDGSTDGSPAIAKRYAAEHPGRIFYCEHDGHAKLGLSSSRNAGIRCARGTYVAFLDADDIWLPDKLSRQVFLMNAHPQASMVYGLTEYWYSWTGDEVDRRRDVVPDLGIPAETLYGPGSLLLLVYTLGQATAPSVSNALITRKLVMRTGGFEDQVRGMFEDQAFLVKAYLKGSVYVTSELFHRYRIHRDSRLSSANGAGRHPEARSAFLSWLGAYFDREEVCDPAILSALQRAAKAEAPAEHIQHNGWLFRVAGTSVADLVIPPGEPDTMRVAISHCDPTAQWDIQLNLPRLTLQASKRYRVRFRAKADRPRALHVGTAMAHDPWQGLGLYAAVDVGCEWQDFDLPFQSSGDDDNARIHFDLGSSDVPVEVADAGLYFEDGAPAEGRIQFGALRRVTPISAVWGFDRGKPVDRHYIERYLEKNSMEIRGRVLEIGDNVYTYRFGGSQVSRSDILHVVEGNPKATIIADLADAPQIPDDTFDCIILTQTLQFIYELRETVETLHRILKPGGVLLATFPGISQTNDRESSTDWYWNFTPLLARRLFGEAFHPADIELEAFGNVLSATAFLHGIAAHELTREELEFTDRGYEVTIGIKAIKPVMPRRSRDAAPSLRTSSGRNSAGVGAILMYHRVTNPGADPFGLTVTPEHFAEQLAVLRRVAHPITLPELADCARRRSIPDRSVVITFDDGYVDNLRHAAPLLEQCGIPATVFITTGALGAGREFWWDELERCLLLPGTLPATLTLTIQGRRYAWELGDAAQYPEHVFRQHRNWRAGQEPPTPRHAAYLAVWRLLQPIEEDARRAVLDELAAWSGSAQQREGNRALEPDELKTLAGSRLVEIGAHTVTHPVLRALPDSIQRKEVAESKLALERLLGKTISSFAYPYGAFSGETAAIVGAAGFDQACSTAPRSVRGDIDRYRLPRFPVGDWDGGELEDRLEHWLAGSLVNTRKALS